MFALRFAESGLNGNPRLQHSQTPGWFGDSTSPAATLAPFPAQWGLRPRDSDPLKTKLPLLPTPPSSSWPRLNFGHWQVLQNAHDFPLLFPRNETHIF